LWRGSKKSKGKSGGRKKTQKTGILKDNQTRREKVRKRVRGGGEAKKYEASKQIQRNGVKVGGEKEKKRCETGPLKKNGAGSNWGRKVTRRKFGKFGKPKDNSPQKQ